MYKLLNFIKMSNNIIIKESAKTKGAKAVNGAIKTAKTTKKDSITTKAGIIIKKAAKTIVLI